ncbi:hypothetical protein TruAng_003649 [Truncatella angustata]|nr:hypothetical protein TruAng_003649 [Truncatella angustata]
MVPNSGRQDKVQARVGAVSLAVPDAQRLEPLDDGQQILHHDDHQPGVQDPALHVEDPPEAARLPALHREVPRQGREDHQQRGQHHVHEREDELGRERRHQAVAALVRVPVRQDRPAPHGDAHGERQAVSEALQVRVHGGGGDADGVPGHDGPRGGHGAVCAEEGPERPDVGVVVGEEGGAEEQQDRAEDLREQETGC